MKYFGPSPWGCKDGFERIDAPRCAPCGHCGEEIGRADNGFAIPSVGENVLVAYHRNCFMRSIFGSVAHQQKRCSCFGGTGEDDPNLSRRAAATAAAVYYYANTLHE